LFDKNNVYSCHLAITGMYSLCYSKEIFWCYIIDTVLPKAIFLVPLIMETKAWTYKWVHFEFIILTDNYCNGKALSIASISYFSLWGNVNHILKKICFKHWFCIHCLFIYILIQLYYIALVSLLKILQFTIDCIFILLYKCVINTYNLGVQEPY